MRNAKHFLLVMCGTLAVSCAYPYIDAGTESTSGGTASNNGGATGSGGISKGSVGGNGGTLSAGGSTNTGGDTAKAGSPSMGGNTASAGGTQAIGGTSNTGGSKASAGTSVTGGMATTGGASSSGGSPATGGTPSATGGATSTGTKGTGGSPATGGAPAATGGAATGGAAAAGCPGTGGPTMVALPLGYCIDSTEVTQGQYQTWLNTSPPTSGQISACSWNMSFTPTCNWTPTSNADYPVVCVDWCDAYAYCAGVGKRLCGKIGGGSNAYNDYASASLSQWYAACTSNGTYLSTGYPYGNTHQATYCNGYDYWNDDSSTMQALPVGSLSTCQSAVSGYAGVYDLSGNVWEWEDSCNGTFGLSDDCRLRGGDFGCGSDYLECGYDFPDPRDLAGPGIGFRCCAP